MDYITGGYPTLVHKGGQVQARVGVWRGGGGWLEDGKEGDGK